MEDKIEHLFGDILEAIGYMVSTILISNTSYKQKKDSVDYERVAVNAVLDIREYMKKTENE